MIASPGFDRSSKSKIPVGHGVISVEKRDAGEEFRNMFDRGTSSGSSQ